MEKIVIDLEVNSDKGIEDVNALNKSIKGLNREISETSKKSSKELNKVGNEANKSVAGASVQVANLGKAGKTGARGLGYVTSAFRGIGIALKAAGIGLILTVLTAITELMRKNQSVLDSFETVVNLISVSFSALGDALSNAYSGIKEAGGGFEALGKVMSGLLTIAIAPLKLGFYQLKLAMETLKVGYESMFGDDKSIKAAKAAVEETKISIMELALETVKAGKKVVNNIGDAITEVVDGTVAVVNELGKIDPKKLVETASNMTKLGNSAEVAASKQSGLVEEFDRLAEKQRQLRDDTSLSIEDRKKANQELGKILEDQEKAMIKQADAQLASARAQYVINGNQENYIALIDAETNRKGVLAAIEGKRSEQKVNEVALLKEEIDLTNSAGEADSALNIQKQKFAAEQILNEQLRLEALIDINEREKIIEEERLQAIIDLANAGTQAKIDAQIALDEFTLTNAEENATLTKELGLKKVADAKAVADAEAAIRQGNLNNVGAGFALLGQLAGKNKALQSAALIGESAVGIAKTVINTQAANSAAVLKYALIPGGLALAAAEKSINNIGAGISIATNVAATAKGLSQLGGGGSAPSGGSIGGRGGGGSAPSLPSLPPSFNVVGASDTNQLADAIGGQSQEPVKAYVVSGDVTSAQSMDRNIVEGASI